MKTLIHGNVYKQNEEGTVGTTEAGELMLELTGPWITGKPMVRVVVDGRVIAVDASQLATAALAMERASEKAANPLGVVGPFGTQFHGL